MPFKIAALAAASIAAALAAPALAQQYPNKAIRVIAAYPSGSGPDTVLRLVGDRLTKAWGQTLVIENRPTGNGLIAAEAAKRAAPDGYTILLVDNAHLAAHPHLYKQLPYDPAKDFDPISFLFTVQFFVTVPAASKLNTMADIIAAAKAAPGRITYGSWGIGSIGHLAAAHLEALTGTQMTHVPFQGVTLLYPAVGTGDVNWAFGSIASAGAVQRAGKIKFIAATAPKRIAGFADIPTVAESGGPPELEAKGWTVLMAPKGTPQPIITQFNAEVVKALGEAEVKERLAAIGFEPYPAPPGEVTRQMEAESRRYAEIIKRSKISLD
jgi:tripartite-type tricarboxylate transporter receptor subunit TctC